MNDLSAKFKNYKPIQKATLCNDVVSEICDKHNIDRASQLAHVIEVSFNKLLLSVQLLDKARQDFTDASQIDLTSNASSTPRFYYEDFVRHLDHEKTDKSIIPLLKAEKGRTKVVSNTLELIKKNIGDTESPPFKVLGSLVRRVIDTYREQSNIEVNFSKNPPTHHERMRAELEKFNITTKKLQKFTC